MKKFILCFAALTMMLVLGSCDKEKALDPNLVYNVTATAEGKVDFSWFNGGASVDGNASIFQCNDTLNVKKFFTEQSMNDALELTAATKSNDKKIKDAANAVTDMISVNGIEGEYHLSIKGYVKYGPLIFRIDEEYPKSE